MANYTMLEALFETWLPQFVLFLDEEQCAPYDGRYMADKATMFVTPQNFEFWNVTKIH
jgi:hypothetical protein